MIDYEMFDRWVEVHDNDGEAHELAQVVIENIVLTGALLGGKVADAIGREVALEGLGADQESYAATEFKAHLELGDPISAVELVFDEVDFLEFEFGQKANGLKCYVMTGMIESEDPTATFDEKRNHLSDLIEWGRMICEMVPEDRRALPKFRSICAAAEARFGIDLDQAINTTSFAHLAAFFREGTPDQVRKTLQNQISAKQLTVNEHRALIASSALLFLKGTPGFPSLWMLPENPPTDDEDLHEPIFIPVCPATFSSEEKPFLPSEKHSDGYRVGVGGTARTIEDYWKALEYLAQSPEPIYQPLASEMPVRCKDQWQRVDRKFLENELASLSGPSNPVRSLTEQIHEHLSKLPTIRAHPIGHTSKLYRYRFDDGLEVALEKRIGEPWLYLRKENAPETAHVEYVDVEGSKQGRNSNLNALPTFADQSLRKFRLTSLGDLQVIIGEL